MVCRYLRAVLLGESVRLGNNDSVNVALRKFREWRASDAAASSLEPNLKNVVYMAGIANGDDDDWEFMWTKFQEATVPSEKRKLLYALAKSKDVLALNRCLFVEAAAPGSRLNVVIIHVHVHVRAGICKCRWT